MGQLEMNHRKLFFFLLFLGTVSLVLAACAPVKLKTPPRVATPPPPAKTYPLSGKSYIINGKRYHVLASAEDYAEVGEASWYGWDFHGKKTASGEPYNMHDLTAAHKILPLNTWVKVTNLTNGREVTLRINDRGPFVRDRIIDLSYAGAKALGMVDPGIAPVRLEVLGAAEEKNIGGVMTAVLVPAADYREGHFAVQVGSFQDPSNSQALAAKLRREFGVVTIEEFDRGDAVFYRVRVSEVKSLGQAMDLQAKLEEKGYRDCFVVAR